MKPVVGIKPVVGMKPVGGGSRPSAALLRPLSVLFSPVHITASGVVFEEGWYATRRLVSHTENRRSATDSLDRLLGPRCRAPDRSRRTARPRRRGAGADVRAADDQRRPGRRVRAGHSPRPAP